jgi:hypothetical protein
MALFKNKWEIKTWAELSASVGDSTNDLKFEPKHRLPYDLQQGAKASKKVGGFFNRESILTAPDYPAGFFIYDSGSGASYTATPKTAFKADMTAFLNSSSLSSAAKTSISASFNGTNFPSLIIQMSTGSYTGSYTSSVTGSGPASASWTVPIAFIGDGQANLLSVTNTSTNATNIILKAGGSSVAGNTTTVEFTLPMETINFSGNFPSHSIAFHSFTGSEYSPETYASSSIWTPYTGSLTTASVIGTNFGSGSITYNAYYKDYVTHTGYIKALGDGPDAIYDFAPKTNILHFPTGSVVASHSYTRYAIGDTGMTGSFASGSKFTGSVYFVSGSQVTAPFEFWKGFGANLGSHIFGDATLATPALPGIYVFSGSATGFEASQDTSIAERTPRFKSVTH